MPRSGAFHPPRSSFKCCTESGVTCRTGFPKMVLTSASTCRTERSGTPTSCAAWPSAPPISGFSSRAWSSRELGLPPRGRHVDRTVDENDGDEERRSRDDLRHGKRVSEHAPRDEEGCEGLCHLGKSGHRCTRPRETRKVEKRGGNGGDEQEPGHIPEGRARGQLRPAKARPEVSVHERQGESRASTDEVAQRRTRLVVDLDHRGPTERRRGAPTQGGRTDEEYPEAEPVRAFDRLRRYRHRDPAP